MTSEQIKGGHSNALIFTTDQTFLCSSFFGGLFTAPETHDTPQNSPVGGPSLLSKTLDPGTWNLQLYDEARFSVVLASRLGLPLATF